MLYGKSSKTENGIHQMQYNQMIEKKKHSFHYSQLMFFLRLSEEDISSGKIGGSMFSAIKMGIQSEKMFEFNGFQWNFLIAKSRNTWCYHVKPLMQTHYKWSKRKMLKSCIVVVVFTVGPLIILGISTNFRIPNSFISCLVGLFWVKYFSHYFASFSMSIFVMCARHFSAS